MFADDKNLLNESNYINTHALNDELTHFASCFAEEKLCLNSSKTQLYKFSDNSFDVNLSSKTVHETECVTNLGFSLSILIFIKKVVKIILTQTFVPKRLRKLSETKFYKKFIIEADVNTLMNFFQKLWCYPYTIFSWKSS